MIFAGVMELADVLDSKSSGSDTVPVRPRSPAPNISGCSAVGSAPALGAGCREFEPLHSDHIKILVNLRFTRVFTFLQKFSKNTYDHMLSHFHFQKPIKLGVPQNFTRLN